MATTPSVEHREIIRLLDKLDPDKSMFDGFEDKLESLAPKFETQDVATIFFQKTVHWFRWRDQQGSFNNPDGSRVEPVRNAKKVKQYSLADIEKMAHNACANGAIPLTRMFISLLIIHLVAVGYEVLPSDS